MVPAVAQALKLGTDHRTDATQHTTPGRVTTLRQYDPFCAPQRMDAEIPDAAHKAVRAQVDIAVRDRREIAFARRQDPVCRVSLAADRLDTNIDRTVLAI
jgi:hypothetical protein